MSGLDNYNKERQLDKRERELELREELLADKIEVFEDDEQWLETYQDYLDDLEELLVSKAEGEDECTVSFAFYKSMAEIDIKNLKHYGEKFRRCAEFYKKNKEIRDEYISLAQSQERKVFSRESFIKIIELEEARWQEERKP